MIFFLLTVFTLPAFAGLGGNVAAVGNDQTRLKASERIVTRQFYSIHLLRTMQGTTIREFVSSSGTVFGVAWQGSTPDLRQVLGDYFTQFMSAGHAVAHRGRGFHLDLGDLVVDCGGHMRFVRGRAYLRSQVPLEVDADEVQ